MPSINHQLARIARREDNVAMRIRSRAAMGELMLHLGRIRSAVRHFECCLVLVDGVKPPNFLGNSAAILAHTHLAWARLQLGQHSKSLVHAEQALATAHASDRPILLAMALGMNAKFYRFRDDASRAAMLAGEAIDIARRQRFTYWHGSALVTLGWAQARDGDSSSGIQTIDRGIEIVNRTGERLMQPVRLGALADAQRLDGQTECAGKTLGHAFESAQATGERFCLAELQRIQAALCPENPVTNSAGHRSRNNHQAGTNHHDS